MTHCGYIAIVGRPNVGKSTLLNKILGKKISITSHKPQTTRHKILGVKTAGDIQAIYVDTPGMHRESTSALNKYMNRVASDSLADVDVVIFVISRCSWKDEDEMVLRTLSKTRCPVILVINKVDTVECKEDLLQHIKNISQKREFFTIMPISAQDGTNIDKLEAEVNKLLPESHFYFPVDQITDRDQKFLASEIIREKLTQMLGQELPYSVAVMIDQFAIKDEILRVAATIMVERDGQKAIVIGKGGEMLKKIGMRARKDMENLFKQKVFLQLWVKVKNSWADDERMLSDFGYE